MHGVIGDGTSFFLHLVFQLLSERQGIEVELKT